MSSTALPRANWKQAYQWLKLHPITLVTTCIFLGYLVSYLLTPQSPWAELYLRAGNQLLAGDNLYRPELGFAYPPSRAMIMIPFLPLAPWAQQVAWWACNAICLVLMCRWMWRLAGGTQLEPVTSWNAEHLIWFAGIVTGIFYVFNGLSNQATDILEMTIMIAGCLALIKQRPLLAATFLGLAAGLKATPLLFCAYLLWRRQWVATAWLVCVALGVNLLPDLISQCPTSNTWLGGWCQQYLAQFQNANYTPGSWGSHVYYNQSLAGMMNRMFLSDWTWANGTLQVISLTPTVSPMIYKLGLLGVEALMLGICAWFCWRRSPSMATAELRSSSIEHGLELSMVLILMVLLSPMSSKSHFCVLIFPGMLLAKTAWEQRSRSLATIFILANVIGIISLTWWGEYIARVSLFYGTVTIKSVLLLAGCGLALIQIRRQSATAIQTTSQSQNLELSLAA